MYYKLYVGPTLQKMYYNTVCWSYPSEIAIKHFSYGRLSFDFLLSVQSYQFCLLILKMNSNKNN